ncbi:MAG: hypothetical protein GY946_31545, partial [bacterium]|nr:hypothetical protein [bacterium]
VLARTQIPPEPLALAMVRLESFLDAHSTPVFGVAGMQLVKLRAVAARE